MPIARQNSLSKQTHVSSIPVIHDSKVGSNVVDTSYNPLASLITFVEGSLWTVNWYSSVISKDTELAGQDIEQLPVYQQYKKINRLDIKIDEAIKWDQDQETKQLSATGGGKLHSHLIPNLGDMFTGDIGDGREGVFQVTNSTQGSIFKDTVYSFEFKLIYISNDFPNKKQDLEKKVILETHYVKDFIKYGQNPIVVTSEYNNIQELKIKYRELINNYFRWFFSYEYSTLILPGQNIKIYDHFLVNFISRFLNTTDNITIRSIKIFNVDDDILLKEQTIWDCFLEQDINILRNCVFKTGLTDIRNFNKNPTFESIYYSRLNHCIYPKNHSVIYNNFSTKLLSDLNLIDVCTAENNLNKIIYDKLLDNSPNQIKMINSVVVDDYYVLSGNFYENYENKTLLEVLVYNHLQKEKIDSRVLIELLNTHYNWGGLEKFYYIPILLVLIRYTLKGF